MRTWKKAFSVSVLGLFVLMYSNTAANALPNLAILSSSISENATVAAGLSSTGQFASITQIFNTSTITATDLALYDVVFTFSDSPYNNAVGVGDALKSYVDAGGAVVAAIYSLSAPWALAGGITDSAYLPFAVGSPGYEPTLPISAVVPADPIFLGIDLTGISFFTNTNYINPILAPGATLLAVDQLGAGMIARNAAGNVIALNIFPGFGGSGDFFDLLANTGVSAANGAPAVVSEPGVLGLIGVGLMGVMLFRRRGAPRLVRLTG